MKRALIAMLLTSVVCLTATCSDAPTDPTPPGGLCPAVVPGPALHLTVIDMQTGGVVTAGVSATWSTGRSSGSFQLVNNGGAPLFVGGENRGGVYTVTVNRSGFSTWTRAGLVVKQGPCGPFALRIAATFWEGLEKAGSEP